MPSIESRRTSPTGDERHNKGSQDSRPNTRLTSQPAAEPRTYRPSRTPLSDATTLSLRTRLSPAHAPPLAESAPVEIAFDERGLVPVVVQDWRTGEVLTLAYANAEAVARTRETGELHLWSRSRAELWHKGATSGNVQRVRAMRMDSDGDALLALVEPAGPACHTGERTCFHNGDLMLAPHE